MKRLPPSQIIAEYRAAYEIANGESAPLISYVSGWFRVRNGLSVRRYRGAQLIYMTAQLNERAKAKG